MSASVTLNRYASNVQAAGNRTKSERRENDHGEISLGIRMTPVARKKSWLLSTVRNGEDIVGVGNLRNEVRMTMDRSL